MDEIVQGDLRSNWIKCFYFKIELHGFGDVLILVVDKFSSLVAQTYYDSVYF